MREHVFSKAEAHEYYLRLCDIQAQLESGIGETEELENDQWTIRAVLSAYGYDPDMEPEALYADEHLSRDEFIQKIDDIVHPVRIVVPVNMQNEIRTNYPRAMEKKRSTEFCNTFAQLMNELFPDCMITTINDTWCSASGVIRYVKGENAEDRYCIYYRTDDYRYGEWRNNILLRRVCSETDFRLPSPDIINSTTISDLSNIQRLVEELSLEE